MRGRWFFVAVPVVYAVAIYLILDAANSPSDEFQILVLVIGIAIAAGVAAYRFADRLEAAGAQAERGREGVGLVGQLSATLSGPPTPAGAASQFLARIA